METRLLILSDAHLFHSKESKMSGINTYRALELITRHIRTRQEHFDIMVALGDLTEDGTEEAYIHFLDLTEGLAERVIWVKGNHDDFMKIPGRAAEEYLESYIRAGSWHLLFLDTTLPGSDKGWLKPGELQRLRRFLAGDPADPRLIFMHHQPMDVGSAFIDDLRLSNKEEFWNAVSGNPSVKGVIFGHVHQETDWIYRGVRLISAPAASVQFKPKSEHPIFETERRGFRTLLLKDNGTLETHVEWI
jgi:Icc protein